MIKAYIDPASSRQFKKLLGEYEKKAGVKIEDAIVDLSFSTGRRLANTVPPFGLSKKTGDAFQGSIAAQVQRAWEGNRLGIYQGSTMEQVHKNARNSRGVVPKRLFRKGQWTGQEIPVAEREAYIRKMQHHAGRAKAGWIAAAEFAKRGKKLSGIPRWIREDVSSYGEAKTKRKGLSTEVDLKNKVRYVEGLQKTSMINKAIADGYRNGIRRMQRIISKL